MHQHAKALVRGRWYLRSLKQRRSSSTKAKSSVNTPNASSIGQQAFQGLLTSAAWSGTFSLSSDVIVQQMEKHFGTKQGGFEVERAVRMAGFGFIIYGPLQHFWYALLDKQFPRKTFIPHFAAKVTLNQLVLAPVVLSSVFTWNLLLQNKSDQIVNKIAKDLVPTMINGWKFWVPAASINFWLVPLKKQVLYMSACSIVWTGYLSYASNIEKRQK